jgi:hypothetical protein
VRALNEVLEALLECAERELRLSIQGESMKRGKLPGWLSNSLDFLITGIEAGSTVLPIEAPVLGETAADVIGQQDFWFRAPDANDTAISLVSKTVASSLSGKLDDQFFDGGVLDGLLRFRPVLNNYAKEIEILSARSSENFQIREAELTKFESIKRQIPEPAVFMVAGQLDLIKHSSRKFQLNLPNGLILAGSIDPNDFSEHQMRSLWGRKVTVKGTVYFSVAGRPRLIEADFIKPLDAGEEIFEKLPSSRIQAALFETPTQKTSVPFRDIWNTWPGEESIEDLLAELKKPV